MIPASYHEFFSTVAEVAGTLIGLLFVAVSLSPEKLNGDDIDFQVRAGVAFVALTNGLVLALVALLPQSNLTTAGYIVTIGGISTCLGFFLLGIRLGEKRHRLLVRVMVRVGALLLLFVLELLYVIDLQEHPHRTSALESIGVLIIAGFAFAIQRAWELVGGGGSGLVPTAARLVAGRVGTPSPAVTPDQPGDHRPPG